MARRRKRRLKKTVKIFLGIFAGVFVIGIGALTYYLNMIPEIDYGSLEEDKNKEEKLGEVNVMDKEEEVKPTLTYTIFDCGHGESIFIDIDDMEVLIDAGGTKEGEIIADKIKDKVDGKLDYVISTHVDENRMGGLPAIYERYEVEKTLYGDKNNSSICKTFFKAAETAGTVEQGVDSTIELSSDATLTLYHPIVDSETSNNNSICCLVTYGEYSFLSTGDAEEKEEVRLQGELMGPITVVVAGNHGSVTSNKLLKDFAPQYFIISAGENNKQNVPNKEVLIDAENFSQNVYGTWKSGDIVFITNSKEFTASPKEGDRLTEANAGGK